MMLFLDEIITHFGNYVVSVNTSTFSQSDGYWRQIICAHIAIAVNYYFSKKIYY